MTATSTVRIRKSTLKALKSLSEATGESIITILDRAVENYRRDRILEQGYRDYQKLSVRDVEEIKEETMLWDNTLLDGLDLEDEEQWNG